ncbi:hypothetical protein I302_100477 [Kwoniella bestiolae CBS 10118]|uniref:Uncharacterized protein n=1 Tax=Kwoniella bestiolae CBS 10118 TaxID=1296100 RepID=A0A1B9G595_9TREE|nr:hypothetical protein I302_03850 [Kwoniella bestiolae CBS 10118]OCF26172.1 hypothetical protein I302_03850 [Kwoniella bestiolae CBS 10118]
MSKLGEFKGFMGSWNDEHWEKQYASLVTPEEPITLNYDREDDIETVHLSAPVTVFFKPNEKEADRDPIDNCGHLMLKGADVPFSRIVSKVIASLEETCEASKEVIIPDKSIWAHHRRFCDWHQQIPIPVRDELSHMGDCQSLEITPFKTHDDTNGETGTVIPTYVFRRNLRDAPSQTEESRILDNLISDTGYAYTLRALVMQMKEMMKI